MYASAPPEDQGLISGIVQTVAQVSTGVTFAIGSSFITSSDPEVLLGEYRKSFYVAMAFAGAAAIIAVLFVKPIAKSEKAASDVESVSRQDDTPSDPAETPEARLREELETKEVLKI